MPTQAAKATARAPLSEINTNGRLTNVAPIMGGLPKIIMSDANDTNLNHGNVIFAKTASVPLHSSVTESSTKSPGAVISGAVTHPVYVLAKFATFPKARKPSGSPLVVPKPPTRKKSFKSHRSVSKVVRDSKHNSPLLKLKMKNEQQKISQLHVKLAGEENGGHFDTVTESSSRYGVRRYSRGHLMQPVESSHSDTSSDFDVEMVKGGSTSASSTSSVRYNDATQNTVSAKSQNYNMLVPQVDKDDYTMQVHFPMYPDTFADARERAQPLGGNLLCVIDAVNSPATPAGLLALPLREQFPAQLSREQVSQMVAKYMTPVQGLAATISISSSGNDLAQLVEETPICSSMFGGISTVLAIQEVAGAKESIQQDIMDAAVNVSTLTVTTPVPHTRSQMQAHVSSVPCGALYRHQCAQNWGQSCYARYITPAALTPFFPHVSTPPLVESSVFISPLAGMNVPVASTVSGFEATKVLAMRNTSLGSTLLEDLIEVLHFDQNGVTTKKDLVIAFFKLASKDRPVMGPYGVPLTLHGISTNNKSPVLQQLIALGAVSVFDLIMEIHQHFDLQWRISVLDVAEGFRRLAYPNGVEAPSKVAAFLQLEAGDEK